MYRREKNYKMKKMLTACVAVSVMVIIVLLTVGHSTSSFVHVIAKEPAVSFSENVYAVFDGYIFRDEEIIYSSDDGLVEYVAIDGERAGVGNVLANVYSGASVSAEEERLIRSQVASLTRQIELLRESKRFSGSTLSSYEGTVAALDKAYFDIMRALADGDLNGIFDGSEEFLMYLNRFSIICGDIDNENELITKLENRKAQLLSVYEGAYKSVIAEKSGYFYHDIDGYEKIFDYSKLDLLDSATLEGMIIASPNDIEKGTVGKLVNDYRWSIAVVSDTESVSEFEEGKVYSVVLTGTKSYNLQMTLSRKTDEAGTGKTVLVFTYDNIPTGFDFKRIQSLEILTDTYSGYRVASSALVEKDGETGVYILDTGVVRFRRVNIIYEGDGYCIVEERDTTQEGYATYLNLHDIIITAGRNLYEGRIIG